MRRSYSETLYIPIWLTGLVLLLNIACSGAARIIKTDWEKSMSAIEPFLEGCIANRSSTPREQPEHLLYIVTFGVCTPGTPVLGPAQRRGEITSPNGLLKAPYVVVAEPPGTNSTNIATVAEVATSGTDGPSCNIHIIAWNRRTGQWGVVFSITKPT